MKKSQKVKNVVIVVTYTYPYISSGIGNVAYEQAVELAKNNIKVTLISSNIPETKNKLDQILLKTISLYTCNYHVKMNISVL